MLKQKNVLSVKYIHLHSSLHVRAHKNLTWKYDGTLLFQKANLQDFTRKSVGRSVAVYDSASSISIDNTYWMLPSTRLYWTFSVTQVALLLIISSCHTTTGLYHWEHVCVTYCLSYCTCAYSKISTATMKNDMCQCGIQEMQCILVTNKQYVVTHLLYYTWIFAKIKTAIQFWL